MEALVVLIFIVAAFVVLDLLAPIAGADSRPGYGDDHRRPIVS